MRVIKPCYAGAPAHIQAKPSAYSLSDQPINHCYAPGATNITPHVIIIIIYVVMMQY